MFTKLQEIISEVSQKNKMYKPINASAICFEVQNIINEIWQNKKSIPKVKSYKNFKLSLTCQNSTDMQELAMLREDIKLKIQEKGLNEQIKEIRFTLDS